jgi:hypothetical protein
MDFDQANTAFSETGFQSYRELIVLSQQATNDPWKRKTKKSSSQLKPLIQRILKKSVFNPKYPIESNPILAKTHPILKNQRRPLSKEPEQQKTVNAL